MHRIQRVGNCFVAESAVVVGDVQMGEGTNIWHQCVARGDVAPIRLGRRVNVQDGSLLHCSGGVTLEIADDVAIGHHAVVHCRSVGSRTLIATRATILDECVIGEDCLIGAGSVVTPRTQIPPGSVVLGIPGRVVRSIRDDEKEYIQHVIRSYQNLATRHVDGEFKPFGVE